MSLGISVVEETFSRDESYNLQDFHFDSTESTSSMNVHNPIGREREPRHFVNHQIDEEDLVNPKIQPFSNCSFDDSGYTLIGKRSNVVVLGDDNATARLVQKLKMHSHITQLDPRVGAQNDPKLANADYYIVAVSTAIRRDQLIDISKLKSALKDIENLVQPGATIIIESVVPVGTTRRLLEPLIRSRRVKGGISPKFTSSSDQLSPFSTSSIKMIAGLEDLMPGSLASIHSLYVTAFPDLISVSSPEIAEMAALDGSGQRIVATAYANEVTGGCVPTGVDPFEICSVLSSSPFSSEPSSPIAGAHSRYTGSIFNYISSVGL